MIPRALLIAGAKELGIDLSLEQVNSVFIYLTELKKWNQKINLTAIREERDIIIKHVLDSLTYIKGFRAAPGLMLLDMGSGAGFPALPIKIAHPEITITMVESVKKKASFLRHIVRTLKIAGIKVVDKRTNELADSFRSSYDVVTARAFAGMEEAIFNGSPFLKLGGLMVLSRGPEETIGNQGPSKAGVVLDKKIELLLPHSDIKRTIWVFKRIK